MIVSKAFHNDFDEKFKWQQHEHYSAALALIVRQCIYHYTNACKITDSKPLQGLNQITSGFDHRVIQNLHDIMAAYWRSKNRRCEPYIPSLEPNNIDDWLAWIPNEIDEWSTDQPQIIKYVMISLFHQNSEKGYEAEELALSLLKEKYTSTLSDIL
jgi:hypothetical protein